MQDIQDYVYCIRPAKSSYFGVGVAEEMVLDAKKDIADELSKISPVSDEDLIDMLVYAFDRIKEAYPNQKLVIEVPGRVVEFTAADAIVYTSDYGDIVFDAE